MLAVESVPAGLTAEILSTPGSADCRIVRISWDPQRGNSLADGARHSARLRAKVGEKEMTLEVPVLCRKDGA